ncbi:MAG: hypothetical protein LAT53_08530 [Idiomarina sp.]|nr:hypothetical protein [Idiomarina sp.]
MQELKFEQVENVSGGVVVNPVTVMVAVRVIKVATPYVKTAVRGATATIAGAAGVDKGLGD